MSFLERGSAENFSETSALWLQALTVVVGSGGNFGGGGAKRAKARPSSGRDSQLGQLVAKGGGHGAGGRTRKKPAASGGSGGGGAFDRWKVTRSSGVAGQGFGGGRSNRKSYGGGGGGGGASKVGQDAPKKHYGGKGGDGIKSEIAGAEKFYGGGGGGGVNHNGNKLKTGFGGLGGNGGGGRGSDFASKWNRNWWRFTGTHGEPNTGGGGGGTDPESRYAGMGGSGVVIVRYPADTPVLVGGQVAKVGGYQVHTFATPGEDVLAFNNGTETLSIDFLVVAGGGGGGSGGGGGGGVVKGSRMIYKGTALGQHMKETPES